MSELESLINRIQQGIDNNRSYIKTIRHPKLLLLSLKELHEMIGNDKVKDAVASDISHLIMSKMRSEQHPEMKEDEVMLNIVLKGEPGVGKTVLGTKIGKIFYSLGYLHGGKKENSKGIGNVLKGVFGDTNNTSTDSTDNTALILYILFIFIIILITFISVAWSFYEKFGGEWTVAMIIVIILLIIIVGYLIAVSINENNEANNVNNVNNANINNIKNNDIKNNNDKECPAIQDEKLPSDSQIIKVVSRDDFVAQYVGWTAPKVNKLLNENLGKVIFVDEAYSLINTLDDSFGNECLTALNLFMSQHPNEIIVIFAGYKNLLEKGVFTAQPGLKRRFMYHFECDGYTPEQLFKIFKLQLAKKGWGVDNEAEAIKIFIKEKDAFPFSGGDTERLTHYAKVEHSREYMKKGEGMKLNKLSPVHISRGIVKLRENSGSVGENDHDPYSDKTSNLMKMLYKHA